MAFPTFDELTERCDRIGVDRVGDTIQYAADGNTFEALQALVNYRDAEKAFGVAEVVAQEITVTSLLKADVPVKPGSNVRLTLSRLPGKTWKPVNVRTDESGTGWEFEVKLA